jgi:KinB signaling pathway activation protein
MAIGVVVSAVVGLLLQFSDREYSVVGISAVGFNVVNMILGGATISVLSQMGFFAYLIVRFIVAGILRSKFVWDMLQMILVVVVLFDLVYLRFSNFESSNSLWPYMVMPLILLVIALGTAYWKVKMTSRNAFVPTLFFMFTVTVLEAVPAIKLNNASSSLFMLAPLLACNAWQILILHKILENKKS